MVLCESSTYFLSLTSVSIMSATTFPTLRLSCLSTYCFDVASLGVFGVGRLLIDFVPMSSGPVIVPPERGSLVAIEPAVEETTLEMEESTYVFVADLNDVNISLTVVIKTKNGN